jgi:prepilin-type N-terminal cleavage/methylation domain-containing protein
MKSEKGFSLLEVMLAIALLGVIIAALMSALSTGSSAVFVADERATAESLAKSQMEYIRNQNYDASHDPPQYALLADIPAGYQIDVTAVRLDPKSDGTAADDGIQKITVTVQHLEKPDVIVLESYRSAR